MAETTTHRIHGRIQFDVGDGIGVDGVHVKALRAVDTETGEEWQFVMDIETARVIGKGLQVEPAAGASIAGLAVPAMGRIRR